jgi:hypothetical protein
MSDEFIRKELQKELNPAGFHHMLEERGAMGDDDFPMEY